MRQCGVDVRSVPDGEGCVVTVSPTRPQPTQWRIPGDPSPAAIRRLREGVELDDGLTSPAQVSRVSEGLLRIVIHEGRNRQVRRMCTAVGLSLIHI